LTLPLVGRKFQEWLGHQYFGEKKKAPKLASERDALRTLAAYARYQGGPRCEVHLRSAGIPDLLLHPVFNVAVRVVAIDGRPDVPRRPFAVANVGSDGRAAKQVSAG
jgi:hypothetical protein